MNKKIAEKWYIFSVIMAFVSVAGMGVMVNITVTSETPIPSRIFHIPTYFLILFVIMLIVFGNIAEVE